MGKKCTWHYALFPAILMYKVLNNALFLNKKSFLIKKSNPPLCYFRKDEDETVFHLYFYCPNVRNLWNEFFFFDLSEGLMLPPLTLHAVAFGFSEKDYRKRNIL